MDDVYEFVISAELSQQILYNHRIDNSTSSNPYGILVFFNEFIHNVKRILAFKSKKNSPSPSQIIFRSDSYTEANRGLTCK